MLSLSNCVIREYIICFYVTKLNKNALIRLHCKRCSDTES